MWKKKQKEPAKAASYVTFYASIPQVEQLYTLGAISWTLAEEARQAGGLKVKLPAHVYKAFLENEEIGKNLESFPKPEKQATNLPTNNLPVKEQELLEELAQRIHKTGMDSPARLFLTTNRPMSFVGSQVMVAAQPMAQMLFGKGGSEWLAKYSHLLEKRSNLDWLMLRLEELAAS